MTGQESLQPGSKTPQGEKQSPENTSLDAGIDSVPERRPESDPGPLPETFGRYRILRKLGEGGMGSVYLAHDSQLDGPVALKIPRFASGHEREGLSRFFREARAAFRIRHPGICAVHDVGEINGQYFISMDYIEGHTLSSVNKPVGAKQAARIIGQLARALQAAHRQGITHRDLKPANVMIDEEQNPIIMDFGLARRETTEESRLTKSGAIVGTPCYMPIEQVQGDWEKIGPHTDIYSLGVMLYELLTGTLPFEGSAWEVLGQIVTQQQSNSEDNEESQACDTCKQTNNATDETTDVADGPESTSNADRKNHTAANEGSSQQEFKQCGSGSAKHGECDWGILDLSCRSTALMSINGGNETKGAGRLHQKS